MREILLLVLLLGCTSVCPKKMKNDIIGFEHQEPLKKGYGLVYVVRPDDFATLARFNVFINGHKKEHKVGYTRGQQYLYLYLKPGKHQINSRAENWSGVQLNVAAGKRYYVLQEPSVGFRLPENELRILEPYEGIYYLRRCDRSLIHKTQLDEPS